VRKVLRVFLYAVLIPAFLMAFAVTHELGHTLLARLLGDPNAVFYLARFEAHSTCLGCTDYDVTRLSRGANMIVSLGGLLATQLIALIALFLLRLRRIHPILRRAFVFVALGFAFLDVPVQAVQGLLYDLNQQIFPTGVDLTDFMLLVQGTTGAGQLLLKGVLFLVAGLYLWLFLWIYRRGRVIQAG
jgi:hypothetical protein